jgi:hypothetical protein
MLTPMLLRLFNKIERGGTLASSFHEASITLIPKRNNDTTKTENNKPISLINIDIKVLNKYLQTEFGNTVKKSSTMIKLASFQEYNNGSTYSN